MQDLSKPVVVGFPLRGEWSVPNTPGTRIPSHGTNRFGTRYAYDFLQVDWERWGNPCYDASPLHYLLFGIQIHRCYCYGKEIYAPCDGTVVGVEDHWEERKKATLFSDFVRAGKNSKLDPALQDTREVTGNYIILKYREGVYAALCHLKPQSIRVTLGQTVKKGDILGNLGHSGNSMFPHLHFQLMDSPYMEEANGLPCAFEQYEQFKNGTWEKVYNGIPESRDRVRFISE